MSAMPKPEKFPVRLIAVDNIKVDQAIQSRVKTDPEYMREFSEAMLRGDVFPPVVVFWDGKRNWLADGFHRHGAAKRAGARDIRCEVRPGARRDAVVWSAGANKAFSIPRTADDIRKAIRMLLDDEEWFGASDKALARHVGCSAGTVRKWFVEYCAETGKSRPDTTIGLNGKTYTRREEGSPVIRSYPGRRGKPGLRATVGGKQHYLGTDPEKADAVLRELIESTPAARRVNDHRQNHRDFFAVRGLLVSDMGFGANVSAGLSCQSLPGCVFTWTNFDRAEDLPLAVGRLTILRSMRGEPLRMVVLCYRQKANSTQIAAAESLGIEFLTPEELAESLKS